MSDYRIYDTIAEKTDGNIYIGVVGPVRTGKSTFIHKFMESTVIPNIQNENERERAKDELPQSGSGRTVTTTEPKFVPSEAVEILLGNTKLSIRMSDCVGFVIDGAQGILDGDEMRMVNTPWSDDAIPFPEAAEIGTLRVTREHSTVCVLVTTDGSICDIPREAYVSAEERTVRELRASGKPFAIILNSASPETEHAHALAAELEIKYSAPVALLDCTKLNSDDVDAVLSMIIGEFPVKSIRFELPDWISVLPDEHKIKRDMTDVVRGYAERINRISDIQRIFESEYCKNYSVNAKDGTAEVELSYEKEAYYDAICDLTGIRARSDGDLLKELILLSAAKNEYEKVKDALADVREKGYGIVMPGADDLTISEPTLEKQSDGYGIRVHAVAESIHMIKADLKTEICPVIGAEEQAAEVVRNLASEYEEDPRKLLDTKMFGRSFYDMVSDGMHAKLTHLPDMSREKLGQTLEKIVNEGANGLICILL